MKALKNTVSGCKPRFGRIWLPITSLALLMAVWAGYAGYVSDNGMPVADDGSWSSEVLANIHEGIVTASPVPLANACGLGASSCFKCHNGKRADLPAEKAWHTDHAKVNHSCVGCHKGNERLMLQNMAHKDLIAKPVSKPQEACQDCHVDGEMQTLLDKYQKDQ
jgi:hypothetical protein